MSSIIRGGDTFHGISVFGRGVFTDDKYGGRTYAGQCKDGYACGLGVATLFEGSKVYTEHSPDGKLDGQCLGRIADGVTFYRLYERGKQKASAWVFADGRCEYNDVACAPDDPLLLALIAQVAPVEVRPAAAAPHPSSPPTRPHAIFRWLSRLVLHPQALAAAVATEVNPHAARRRWWLRDTAQQQPHCSARPRSDACTDRFPLVVSQPGTLVHPHTRARPGSFSSPCHAQHAATRGGLLTLRTPRSFPRAFSPGFAVSISRSVWQAEEAVANLSVRLAVRVSCAQHDGVSWGTEEALHGYSYSRGTIGVYRYRGKHGPARSLPLSAPSLLPARACVLLQGLELLVTKLLARNRQPPPTVAAGVPHAELAAELISLPSGLLAMVCEAIVKLKVRLGAACVRAFWLRGRWERADEVPARVAAPVRVLGAVLASRGGRTGRTVCGVQYGRYYE
jgi:hypothetical protein